MHPSVWQPRFLARHPFPPTPPWRPWSPHLRGTADSGGGLLDHPDMPQPQNRSRNEMPVSWRTVYLFWITFQEEHLIMTREGANLHWRCQADDNEPHPQSGSFGYVRKCATWNLVHVDAHGIQLMLKSGTGHETVQSRGQLRFGLFVLVFNLSFTGSHPELSQLSVCRSLSLICCCCCRCHLSELGRTGYALPNARRRGWPVFAERGFSRHIYSQPWWEQRGGFLINSLLQDDPGKDFIPR